MHNLDLEELVSDKAATWSNEDNNIFYESIKANGMREFAKKGGLTTGCDMEVLTPYWSKAESILDVGAGYGRAIHYLLKHHFQGMVTGIERCNILFEHLQTQFNRHKNVHLLHGDIRHLNDLDQRFNLILYMWSGIGDFAQLEQGLIVKNLRKLLLPKGKLIIDTIPINIMPLGVTKLGEQLYSLKANNFIKYIYEPNADEIKKYAERAGFSKVDLIPYETDTKRKRWLHILS